MGINKKIELPQPTSLEMEEVHDSNPNIDFRESIEPFLKSIEEFESTIRDLKERVEYLEDFLGV